MRTVNQSLCVSLVLAGLLNVTSAGQKPWYYRVNSAAPPGNVGTAHQDYGDSFPDPNGCWHNISDALNAIKADGHDGPWVVQVDDTARYDDSVTVWGFKTNATTTLTIRKNPALKGRPTVYPAAQSKAAFNIGGDSQADGENSDVTIQGFIMSNNASGTERNTEMPVFADCQANLTTGRIVIEDCIFDGLGQTYDTRNTLMIYECRVDTIFRNNEVRNFTAQKKPTEPGPERNAGLLVVAPRKSSIVGEKRVQVVRNSFHDNTGILSEFSGNPSQKCGFSLLYEGNRVYHNTSNPKAGVLINIEGLDVNNIIVNNLFYDNAIPSGWQTTLLIYGSGNTKIYHNTFFNNHAGREVVVATGSAEGVELKNNIFWPTAGSYCIEVQGGCTEHLISANNAFFTDFKKDGSPPGSGFSVTEDTETVGLWNGKPMTTDAWNKASKNNAGNGYTFEGPGLDKNMHLIAGSLCIDRGIPGLATDDIDGKRRPVGAGFDIGASEYGTDSTPRSLGGKHEPQFEDQPLVLGAISGDAMLNSRPK
jgi:hypothetical protein